MIHSLQLYLHRIPLRPVITQKVILNQKEKMLSKIKRSLQFCEDTVSMLIRSKFSNKNFEYRQLHLSSATFKLYATFH